MEKLLIANRGEIACRIIRTARRMGIKTIAAYSDADAHALHVRQADEAVRIGPAALEESYLSVPAVIDAAIRARADAIHPGYGLLSEDAAFAEAVRDAGLIFVGPSAEALRVMGLKDSAKARMKAAGLPVIPGYMGEDQGLARLEKMAELLGYPLMIKAVAGGGAKGLRPVFHKSGFTSALLAAKREAQASFGNDGVMLEKLISRPRHVEVQIFGDSHGNIVHLFERDCSLQRHHRKLIEETPAPGLSERLRHILGIAAVTAGMTMEYCGAGTVEFLLDTDDLDEEGDPRFYFMEMNARLQVEHPVTEAVTGQDLVEWQLRVAKGGMLPLMQDAIETHGHAIEARLYAEDPHQDFHPSTGTIERLRLPETMRVDTGVEQGDDISEHHAPLLAKLIVHAPARQAAIDQLVRALDTTVVEGLVSNRAYLARALDLPDFRNGAVHTGMLATHAEGLLAPAPEADWPVAVAALVAGGTTDGKGGVGFANPFRLNLPVVRHGALYTQSGRSYRTAIEGGHVSVNGGKPLAIALRHEGAGWQAQIDGMTRHIAILEIGGTIEVRESGHDWHFRTRNPAWDAPLHPGPSDGKILAPMAGKVRDVLAAPGQRVVAGAPLLVLEAMWTEHKVVSPITGILREVTVKAGEQVQDGACMLRVEVTEPEGFAARPHAAKGDA